jgi:hypothetical protein
MAGVLTPAIGAWMIGVVMPSRESRFWCGLRGFAVFMAVFSD